MRLDSISKKFLAPTLALTIVLLGGLGSFIAVNNNAAIRSMIESKGNSSADFMNKIGTTYYSNFDFLAVEDMVKEIIKDPEVAFAVFYDDQNKPLTKTSVEPRDTSSLIIFERAIKADNGSRLGTLRLGYNKKNLSKNLRNSLFIVGAGTVVAILLLAIGITYLVNRIIIQRMAQTMNVIKDVARGDLTKDLSGMADQKATDEIAELGGAASTMVENLKGMIGNVLDVTSSIGASSMEVKQATGNITMGSRTQSESMEEAASSINEMHSSLKEIGVTVQDLFKTSETTSSSVIEMAASIDEVAKTMTNLSSSIEETSAAIDQMSAAVRQIAEHVEVLSSAAEETAATSSEISASVREVESSAKESASLAESVAADAQQLGISSIDKTIEGMGRIESTARRTADVVNSLGKRAENIGSILTVIEEITDQTGLLALNAAILAAQAGEQGKGFAVVAAEIRELANRTEASTKEISTLISSVQAESREAVVVMREEISIVEEGVKLARNAGEALQKILERADKSRDMSRRISQAAAEQNRGIRQVNEAVVKISEMTHQIAQATKEQKNGSEQIARASERMRELTRFVKASTDEQAKGGKDISVAVENITGKIGMVNRAAGEVQSGSDLIVHAIERIKEIARSNADMAAGLNSAMDVMIGQSETLKKEIEKFRMNREKADRRLLENVRDTKINSVFS